MDENIKDHPGNIGRDMSNLLDESQKRPWLSMAGLLIGLLSWIAVFSFSSTSLEGLHFQLYLLIFMSLVSIALSFAGRRRARSFSIVGMVVGGSLLLFLLLCLVGLSFAD